VRSKKDRNDVIDDINSLRSKKDRNDVIDDVNNATSKKGRKSIANNINNSINNINNRNKNSMASSESGEMKLKFDKLKIKNEELNLSKDKLEDKIKEQQRAFYISSNFDKIDSGSFDDLHVISRNFSSDGYPQMDINNYKVIKNNKQMEKIVHEAQNFKNMYAAGDIVNDKSSFNISRDNICYRSNGKPMKLTKKFKEKYPECMVCNTVPQNNLKDSDSWRNTKTNINEVCLFNSKSENNSGIPNLKECKNMCKV